MKAVARPGGAWARWKRLFAQLHRDQQGAVSVESMLIIAAIALPILIFIIKVGWPRIKDYFNRGMNELEGGGAAGGAP
jgi:Flp pilus assembly pilin Flp